MTNDYIRREDAKMGLSKTFGRLNADIANYVIDKVEPADVAPVVHGKWTRILLRNEKGGCIGAEMICSECGSPNGHDEKTRFCPHCGAKMDGI